jgi:hypothetical protein
MDLVHPLHKGPSPALRVTVFNSKLRKSPSCFKTRLFHLRPQMPDLKAAALGNVNLSDLESHIVMLGFACVRRKWFFSRFLCFFPLLV